MASNPFTTPSPIDKVSDGAGEDGRRDTTNTGTGLEPAVLLSVIDNTLVDPAIAKRERREEMIRARARARAQAGVSEVARAPEKTLYSYSTEEELSHIQIPLQIKHTSTRPLLTEEEADTPCSSFDGLEGLLGKLNQIFGTEQALSTGTGDDKGGLRDAIQMCIDRQWDFGTAYGYLRTRWHDRDRLIKARMDRLKNRDIELRAAAIDHTTGRITQPRLPPRRVWDLYSNRVLPEWAIGPQPPWAISHSWMSPELRHNVWTTINGKEWPVPIPKDTTLARIRVELINLGAQYAWLDVLCLRQQGPAENEGTRLEEWKLDVPTIGNVYQQNQQIVHYFSGLGRPLVVGDLDSDRHWLNRAWTLQEISMNGFKAGVHSGSREITHPELNEKGEYPNPQVGRFHEAFGKLYTLAQDLDSVFDILRVMRKRAAMGELDKIAGLGYLLRCKSLPQYDTTKTSNQAFSSMLEVISSRYRGDLFFRFPHAGTDLDTGRLWAPSWDQILAAPDSELPETKGVWFLEDVELNDEGRSWYDGFWADNVEVAGFSTIDPKNSRRQGLLRLKDDTGTVHTFQVYPTDLHQVTIPDGVYTVALGSRYTCFVVGKRDDEGMFAKVSTLKLLTEEDEDKMQQSIGFRQKLGISKRRLCLI
ncbi:hypothetical protein BKA70DRAFT_470118 [Coprinopsis sp. MPI-PUGE-AT-0042]|nr:hypothetical protein BKA70DRAFT_470118 [Coprinopsis sp. MPI-PUGE-AT-0042]